MRFRAFESRLGETLREGIGVPGKVPKFKF